jgi:hypothetical protein
LDPERGTETEAPRLRALKERREAVGRVISSKEEKPSPLKAAGPTTKGSEDSTKGNLPARPEGFFVASAHPGGEGRRR